MKRFPFFKQKNVHAGMAALKSSPMPFATRILPAELDNKPMECKKAPALTAAHNAVLAIILGFPMVLHAEPQISWNGYGTLGVNKMDGREEIDRDHIASYGFGSDLGSAEDSNIGLQAHVLINPKLDFAAQVIARGTNEYTPELEWAYAKFALSDSLELMLGRQRRSTHLHSANIDVGYSYQFIRPPKTAYITIGPLFDAIESASVFYHGIADSFDFSVQAYVGHAEGEVDIFGEPANYEEMHNAGLTLGIETENSQFHASYHASNFDIENAPGGSDQLIGGLYALGLTDLADKYKLTDENLGVTSLGFSTEFYVADGDSPWRVSGEVTDLAFGDSLIGHYLGSYLMLEKGIGDFTLHGLVGQQSVEAEANVSGQVEAIANVVSTPETAQYFQQMVMGLTDYERRQSHKRSVIGLGLRYEASSNVAIKFEHEYIKNHVDGGDGRLYSAAINFVF